MDFRMNVKDIESYCSNSFGQSLLYLRKKTLPILIIIRYPTHRTLEQVCLEIKAIMDDI